MAQTLVLFDGVCGLCNGFVDFLLPRDTKAQLLFGALQSDSGRKALREAGLPDAMPETVVVIDEGRAQVKEGSRVKITNEAGATEGR